MHYDMSYRAVQPARIPNQKVTVDVHQLYGPTRLWGTSTPLIVRARGWEPTPDTPGEVVGTVQTMWADYWVYVRIPVVAANGEVLRRSLGLLVPPQLVTPRDRVDGCAEQDGDGDG